MFQEYDVIVIGGGHAGCEAANASAKLGSMVLMITMNMNTIGQMSCNPAMGGVAKGQIVREIDALGGLSGIVADKSTIQFRMLNMSKGPAMWSPRTQNDRFRFAEEWRLALEGNPNIDFWQDSVIEFLVSGDKVVGVKTRLGIEIYSKAVILATGTFLSGKIHVGKKSFGGGRMGDKNSTGLTEQLKELGFTHDKLKTGTPVRVDGRSIDYSVMEEQKGDGKKGRFSFSTEPYNELRQLSCYITYTNPEVHDILREGFDDSPMFCGAIEGDGPRYCPSIEDKITRFQHRERHQIFVEPEGENTCEVYVNGFSSSLPEDVQLRGLRKIKGFENAKIFRPGYAIEYDFFHPTQLKSSLETKIVNNLFFAGQINGTTGYEEAGGQGLMAGINAHKKINNKAPLVLARSQAYIGVLIDDLINKGTKEPYRMFTSRAEYRLSLRQDNADERLTPLGYELGLVDSDRLRRLEDKLRESSDIEKKLSELKLDASSNQDLESMGSRGIRDRQTLRSMLKRPEISIHQLGRLSTKFGEFVTDKNEKSVLDAQINIKYEHYFKKEKEEVEKQKRFENLKIPTGIDYHKINSLSAEAKEKLSKLRPETLGQASRISGVSPADISALRVLLKSL